MRKRYELATNLPRCELATHKLYEEVYCTRGDIRLKLLKIGAHVRVSVRRVYVSMASSYPYQQRYFQIFANLKRTYPQLC